MALGVSRQSTIQNDASKLLVNPDTIREEDHKIPEKQASLHHENNTSDLISKMLGNTLFNPTNEHDFPTLSTKTTTDKADPQKSNDPEPAELIAQIFGTTEAKKIDVAKLDKKA